MNDINIDLRNYGDLQDKKETVKRAWQKNQAASKTRRTKAQEDLLDSDDMVDDDGVDEEIDEEDVDPVSKFE